MKLTDIKNKILEQLNKLTIDDFYALPTLSFAKEIFCKMTRLQTDKQIEKYLIDEFPKTRVESLSFSLQKGIIESNKLLLKVDIQIENLINRIEEIEKECKDKMEKDSNIPNQAIKISTELEEIEKEIQQLKPLAKKSPYNNQINLLESKKLKKSRELSSFSSKSSDLRSEVERLQLEMNTIKENIKLKKLEKGKIQSSIKSKGKDLAQLKKNEDTFYKNEYLSLEFLFMILLQNKIKSTTFYFPDVDKGGFRYLNDGTEFDLEYVKKVEIELNCSKTDLYDVYKYIFKFINSALIIPREWRTILYQTLSKPLPSISGTISHPTEGKHFFFEKKVVELSNLDSAAFLSLKIAASTNHSLKTDENKIILALSGGLLAIITFREKGGVIKKLQQHPLEIYINCFKYKDQYISQTLYSQTGYADSTINIVTPGAYYIICDNFVIEIEFCPAPILFDTSRIERFAPNISSKAKHEDEIRKQQEEDDWD